jgi:S1-C subfamily serine protease
MKGGVKVPALKELEDAIKQAAGRSGGAVVGIGRRWGAGSGVVVGEGKVVTNAHNVHGDEVTVTFADGRTVEAEVAGIDTDGDLAVLSVDTAGTTAIEWAESEPEVGSAVVALANPGGRGLRATLGFVSGTERAFRGPRGRRIAGGIEHTAPLPRGSSGGPIVDAAGSLLGINTNRTGEGFYLAIPADTALRERIESLGRGESVRPTRLGVAIAPPFVARRLRRAVGLPERDGLLVQGVEEGGAADRAGLQRGDLITEAGGQATASADDLHAALDAAGADGSLTLTVIRGTEERTVSVSLAREASERGEA